MFGSFRGRLAFVLSIAMSDVNLFSVVAKKSATWPEAMGNGFALQKGMCRIKRGKEAATEINNRYPIAMTKQRTSELH